MGVVFEELMDFLVIVIMSIISSIAIIHLFLFLFVARGKIYHHRLFEHLICQPHL